MQRNHRSPDHSPPSVNQPEKSCSQCRTRKVKCDMSFPRCQGCAMRNLICEFAARRKPGPPKGTKRKRDQDRAPQYQQRRARASPTAAYHDPPRTSGSSLSDAEVSLSSPIEELPQSFQGGDHCVLDDLECYCIKAYRSIQQFPYLPPLTKNQIIAPTVNNSARRVLIQAVCAISLASLRNPKDVPLMRRHETASTFAKRAKSALLRLMLEEEAPVTLELVKAAIVLSAYELTCSPGVKGWYMVGQTVRLAYDMGLDHLDDGQQFGAGMLLPEDIEEQRHVWWCVYALDTYVSATLMRPFGVTEEVIKTALVGHGPQHTTEGPFTAIFLPSDLVELQIAIQSLDYYAPQSPKVLTLLLLSMLRQVSALRRRQFQGEQIEHSLELVRNCLASCWFSLPSDLLEKSPAEAGQLSPKRLWTEALLLAHFLFLSATSFSLTDSKDKALGKPLIYGQRSPIPWELCRATSSTSTWKKCLGAAMDISAIVRDLSPAELYAISPFTTMVLWLPVIVLALQVRSTYEPNEQRTAESAFQVVNAALRKLAPVWKIVHNIEEAVNSLFMNVEMITSTDEACQILYMYRSPLVIINSNQITIRMPADCRQLDGVDDWLQLDLSSLNSWADWNTGLFAPGPGEENGMYFISGL